MRLKRSSDFERVYAGGRAAQDLNLRTVVAPNGLTHSRLGLSVGKRYGNAVRRNRFKRLAREAFRLNRPRLPAGFDIIVIPGKGRDELSESVVGSSLVKLVSQAVDKLGAATRGGRDAR